MPKPRCRICGCTQDDGCPGGCGWSKPGTDPRPICTICAAFREDLIDYCENALDVTPRSLARLLTEIRKA